MVDIRFIRDNPKIVKAACENKGHSPKVVENLLKQDEVRLDLLRKVESLKAERNKLNDELKKERTETLMKQAKDLKKKLQDLEPTLRQADKTFHELMLQIPNVPFKEVPIGKDEKGNKKMRTWGKKLKFDFDPKDHVELGTDLDLFDIERGVKVAGFKGYFLKNDGVMLTLAIMRLGLDKLISEGYTPMIPPTINRRTILVNSGQLPWGEKEGYKLSTSEADSENDYFLAGTAEWPLVSYHAGEILKEKDLPLKFVGFSPCYRREIGNYGKDTKGIYRVHEFMKVEQVVICKADDDESRKMHEQMLDYTEEIHQDLELHYRVMLMCTGDMGEPQAKKYDIETWMPGRNGYGETASDSIVTDFQSRRANIRYQTKNGLKFVHMLNNTVAPSTRLLIAILETHQQKDGSIKIPKALVPYFGKKVIEPKKK